MAARNDDLEIRLGIAVALGLTIAEACDLCDVTSGTYYKRTENSPDFEKYRAFTVLASQKSFAKQVAKVATAQTAEEKIVSRLDGSLKITDKIIKHLTEDEDYGRCAECKRIAPDIIKELLAGQKAITQWIGKYAASEAPKRLQINGTVTHEHVAIQDSTVDAIAAFQSHLQRLPLPPADVIEAQIVDQ